MALEGNYEPGTNKFSRAQAEAYEASHGANESTLRGMPTIVLTSVGAKTGFLRKNPLMRVEHDSVYAVVASNGGSPGHPTWYYNLAANPHVELQDGNVKGDFEAREAVGAERQKWWERAVAVYPDYDLYAQGLGRTIPVFVLEPRH
jgi:deazaflavin-dependent oxidoreductase (nitroreductase family)